MTDGPVEWWAGGGDMPSDPKPLYRRIPGFRSGRPWKMVLALIVYLALLNGFIETWTTTPAERAAQTQQAEQAAAERAAAAQKAAEEREAARIAEVERLIKSADSSISYKAVVKNLDAYKGKVVSWSGRVMWIREDNGTSSFQVMNDDWDTFLVYFDDKLPDVFKDDRVKVIGQVDRIASGKNAFGAKVEAIQLTGLKVTKLK